MTSPRAHSQGQRVARAGVLLLGLASVLSCSTQLELDPSGYRCESDGSCPRGYLCVAGACRSAAECAAGDCAPDGGGEVCAGVVCATPPDATCTGARTLRRYGSSGTCALASGACEYPYSDTPCSTECLDGACVGEPCAGQSCVTPPPPGCTGASTLRTYASVGTCQPQNGLCDYAASDVTCQNGCENGACKNQDLCANKSCGPAPEPLCVPGAVRTWTGAGTCQSATGQCQYAYVDTPCKSCQAGTCLKAFEQTLPRVRAQVNAVDQAPGSLGKHVLAVGPKGYVARYDGQRWTKLASNTQSHLRAVWLGSATFGLVVGDDNTVLHYDGQGLSPAALPQTTPASLVAVHGQGTAQALVASADGRYFRYTNGSWTSGTLPSDKGPYALRAAYVDPQGRERLVGGCRPAGSGCGGPGCGCVALAPNGQSAFTVKLDTASTSPFTAAGPALEADGAGYAFLGREQDVRRQDALGTFDGTNAPQGLGGAGVVAISDAQAPSGRAVYLLTQGGAIERGRLYRYQRTGGAPQADPPLLWLYHEVPSLSRTDSGGVIVSDAKATGANLFRVGPQNFDVLDLVESWRAASVAPSGDVYLMNGFGDLAVLEKASGAIQLHASPVVSGAMRDVAAGSAFSVLVGDSGEAYRFQAGSFVPLPGAQSQHLLALCRVSDGEWYAVGEGGKAYRSDGTGFTALTTPAGLGALNDVFCAGPQNVVAVGAGGAVVKLSGSAFVPLTPAAPTGTALLSVWASPKGLLYVSGNNVFLRYDAGSWSTLPGVPALHSLAVFGPKEVYAASGNKVLRFDGASWSLRVNAPAALTRADQTVDAAVYVGLDGLLLEGR